LSVLLAPDLLGVMAAEHVVDTGWALVHAAGHAGDYD
jgi:hypothetical protein